MPELLIEEIEAIIERGGRASIRGSIWIETKNPYHSDSIEARAWQYGFDNRVARFDLTSAMQSIINRKRGNLAKFFAQQPAWNLTGWPRPTLRYYPCPSISKDGRCCELPLGHAGIHTATYTILGDWKGSESWTTERQSVDSGNGINDRYLSDAARIMNSDHWRRMYEANPWRWTEQYEPGWKDPRARFNDNVIHDYYRSG